MIYRHRHPLFIDKLKRRLSEELDRCCFHLYVMIEMSTFTFFNYNLIKNKIQFTFVSNSKESLGHSNTVELKYS